MQKRLFNIGRSNECKCQACHEEEGTEKHRLCHCPGWNEVRRQIPEACRKWEQKARTSKNVWKYQRGVVTHLLNESQRNIGYFSMKKVEWDSLRSIKVGTFQQKGFKAMLLWLALFWVLQESAEHVVGHWCNWIMMKNWDFCMGCIALWMLNLRAGLTAFFCLLKEVIGPTKVRRQHRNYRWAMQRIKELHRSESWRC